jgi:cytohesin
MTGRTHHGEEDPGLATVMVLVERGACLTLPDHFLLQPLHHAAMRGNIRVVEYLVSAACPGVQLDCRDRQESTPLHIAATYGNTGVAELLLGAGANSGALDYQQQNPLHRAAKEGNNSVVEAIVDRLDEEGRRGLLKQQDNEHNTPLLLAVQVPR